MFAIHIASCLVDENRTKYLIRVLNELLKNFPTTPIYIGFDIAGAEHENGKDLLPILQKHNTITCFTHMNGLGYSWNHPWTLHNYDIVLQIEDDWDVSGIDIGHVEAIHSNLNPSEKPIMVVMKRPENTLRDIIQRHDNTFHIINVNKFIKSKHFYVFSNHPHFQSRSFHKLLGGHPENVPPPDVEVSFVDRCSQNIKSFTTYSICKHYGHFGESSINHGVSWTGEISKMTPSFNLANRINPIKEKLAKNECELVYTDDKNNIYSVLKKRNSKSTLVMLPNIYMVQDYRLRKIIPFVASFFDKCLVFVGEHTREAEAYFISNEVKQYFGRVEKLYSDIYLLKKQ
ncbi:putative glycosyl transferase [Yasminevirus sp. GU-2018]|uniref:Putative glycosyl transferase n=1 Tax=Yasminevirus sp. GU-2018 TaxID=2420051 RepID=A0A5K0UBK5_9VIRU|nr:putative glycosyl transferase [Yasminevirus sp. GU-2018]